MISILVISFGNKSIESITINALISQLDNHKDISLYIYNNGPEKFGLIDNGFSDKIKSKFKCLNIYENVNNNSLSHIYNDFLSNVDDDYYMLLDDDTKLPVDYLNSLKLKINNSPDSDLFFPIILSEHNNFSYYPIINSIPYGNLQEKINNLDSTYDVTTVGSGLVLNKNILLKISKSRLDPFDERFALYGVDFSLFRNIKLCKESEFKYSILREIYHDMSGVERKISRFRFIERELDNIISARNYSKNIFKAAIKFFVFLFKYSILIDFKMLKNVFFVFQHGMHPRCFSREKNLFSIKFKVKD